MVGSVTKFQARHGTLAYTGSPVTWDTSTPIDDETFDANVASVKDITLEVPKQEFNKISTLGNVQQTIGANAQTVGTATGAMPGYWQTQAMIPNDIGTCKFSGTLVLTGDEQFVDILGLGNSQAITGGYTRYGVGTLESDGSYTQNFIGSLRFYLNNGSEEEAYLCSNSHITIGDVRPTGADGHWEIEFTGECLAKDFAKEVKD